MTEAKAKEAKDNNAYWLEKVTIHLFKDSGKYKDAVTVGYNGRFYQIERGKDVSVPRAVAEILKQSQEQDQRTAEMIEQQNREYAALERANVL